MKGFTQLVKQAVFGLVVSAVCLSAAGAAQAQDWYAVVSIENRTGTTVPYSLKWGEGQWRKFSLPPGGSYTHSWEFALPNQDDSPPLYIAFDSDLKGGVVNRTSYSLQKYVAPNKKKGFGKEYTFDRVGGGYIDLFPRN